MTELTAKSVNRVAKGINATTMITDYQGNTVPQYFDETLNRFVPITATWGAGSNFVVDEGSLNKVVSEISKVSMITDYLDNVVPQYFDTNLVKYVPITNTWGGGSGGGEGTPPDLSEIEGKIRDLESSSRKSYLVKINKSKPTLLQLDGKLGLEFSFKKFTQSTTDDPPENRGAEGFVLMLGNMNSELEQDVYISLNTSGYQGRYYPSGGWYEWRYGNLAPFDGYNLMTNHPGFFDSESMTRLLMTNVTSKISYDISFTGLETKDNVNYFISVTVDCIKLEEV